MSFLQRVEYKWLVAAVFVSGLFMELLDTTIVNVALPAMADDLGVDNSNLEWIITAYLLSLAVFIPASGWLGDRFGTKRIFLFALALFTAGSLLCGLAWSLGSLIAFRVVQGIGGGMLTPVGTAMLFRAFPPNERAKASSVLVVPIAIAPTIGPVVGGVLVDNASWHWIFFINVPIGVAAFFFALAVLREHTEPSVGRFDLPGFLLSATGLPLLLYGISEGPSAGWGSAEVLLTLGLGVLLLVALVVVETRVAEPMLALRLFANRMFRSANLANFMASAGLIGAIFLLPLFLQQLRGLSATQSGLATFPQALGLVAVARLASGLYPKVGPRRMLAVGLLGTAVTTLGFLAVDLETDIWWIRLIMFGRGIFFGLALIPLQAATFATITPQDQGRASSLFSTNRQVASSIGVALLATILAERTAAHLAGADPTDPAARANAALAGFHDAFLGAVVLALIGAVFALFIHDEDAAASMVTAQTRPAGDDAEPAFAD